MLVWVGGVLVWVGGRGVRWVRGVLVWVERV